LIGGTEDVVSLETTAFFDFFDLEAGSANINSAISLICIGGWSIVPRAGLAIISAAQRFKIF